MELGNFIGATSLLVPMMREKFLNSMDLVSSDIPSSEGFSLFKLWRVTRHQGNPVFKTNKILNKIEYFIWTKIPPTNEVYQHVFPGGDQTTEDL